MGSLKLEENWLQKTVLIINHVFIIFMWCIHLVNLLLLGWHPVCILLCSYDPFQFQNFCVHHLYILFLGGGRYLKFRFDQHDQGGNFSNGV